MSGFLDRISGAFFKEVEDPAPEEFQEPIAMPNERALWREQDSNKNKKSNIMAIPGREKTMEMVLIKATTYDDMQIIARHIKERRVAVVNFEEMDKATAQRMVDFLSGAVFALEGVPKKVSSGTFIFSTSTVDMSGQIMEGGGISVSPNAPPGESDKNFAWRPSK
ncbi:MAG: cell division protein SepF [Clostridiales bacterium]|nr:cell division protein SepF [Clostridiales bacterium]